MTLYRETGNQTGCVHELDTTHCRNCGARRRWTVPDDTLQRITDAWLEYTSAENDGDAMVFGAASLKLADVLDALLDELEQGTD